MRVLRISAVPLEGVDGIEQAAERIVDFMRHAGGETSEAGEPLLLRQLGAKRFAFGHGRGQSVEGFEWPLVVAAGGGDDLVRNGIDLPVVTALEIARQQCAPDASCGRR